MLVVRKLVWDAWNVQHITRHHVEPFEVEVVCHGNSLVLRGQEKGRLVVSGETEEGRILGVVLEARGKGKYYPVTAYDADANDKKLYSRLRGGDNNETDEE